MARLVGGTGGETSFRARAGLLTLAYLTSSMSRPGLLAMLAEASSGVRDPDREDWLAEIELDDEEPEELDLEAMDAEDMLAAVEIDPGLVTASEAKMQITPEGREAAFVGSVLERWFASAPERPLTLGEEDASTALAALLLGWSSTVVQTLAAQPTTLQELHDRIEGVDPEIVEGYVDLLETNRLAESMPAPEGEVRYAATDWLREAIAPLAAAARMERRYPRDDMAPVDTLDVETAFLLTAPLVELPARLSSQLNGACRLGVELEGRGGPQPAGVTVRVEEGRVISCALGLDEGSDAWAVASAEDWLDTVIEPDAKRVRTGGDRLLARVLLDGLHRRLFG